MSDIGDVLFSMARARREQANADRQFGLKQQELELRRSAEKRAAEAQARAQQQTDLQERRFRYGAAADISKEIGESYLPPDVVAQQMQLRGQAAGLGVTPQAQPPAPEVQLPPRQAEEPTAQPTTPRTTQVLTPSETEALGRGERIEPPAPQATPAQLESLMASAHPDRQASWAAAAQEYDTAKAAHDEAAAHPVFQVAVGPGKPLTVRLGQAEQARIAALNDYAAHAESQMAEDFPGRSEFHRMVQAALATPGAHAKDVEAEYQKWLAGFQLAQSKAFHEAASTERAGMVAGKPPKPFHGTTPEERDRVRRQARTDKDFDKAIAIQGLDKTTQTYGLIGQVEQQIESDNPETQRQGLLALWRITQGDPRMSDKDYPLATSSIGGMGADFVAKLKYVFGGGGYDAATISQALKSIDTLRGAIRARHEAATKRLLSGFSDESLYDSGYAKKLLLQNIPDAKEYIGGSEATPAAPAAEATSGGVTVVPGRLPPASSAAARSNIGETIHGMGKKKRQAALIDGLP